ncbi:hypothetical protein K438DRAFT_1970820 [Mycena galopus ATCC 62051]|nr:hypothetical protein K438DRAFT_1970820 [Mycena galopus ATCC 62051]
MPVAQTHICKSRPPQPPPEFKATIDAKPEAAAAVCVHLRYACPPELRASSVSRSTSSEPQAQSILFLDSSRPLHRRRDIFPPANTVRFIISLHALFIIIMSHVVVMQFILNNLPAPQLLPP